VGLIAELNCSHI